MFKLPELTYGYDDLKKWVGGETMRAHHDHHHQTYVDKLNAAVEQLPRDIKAQYFGGEGANDQGELSASLTQLLKDFKDQPESLAEIPAAVKTQLINNGGGHLNHAKFWQMLTPHGAGEPTGELKSKLAAKYGSFQNFTDEWQTAATGRFGSGWAWLLDDLSIATTANQDQPDGQILLGLDLWEHAYYLDYKWNRADYVKAWWAEVNWDYAAAELAKSAR
jgi:Fe-Mn family superoxide dismutase